MSDETFNGIDHAEEIFFKSALDTQETLERICNRFPRPGDYIDVSDVAGSLLFTKRRLFFCEYNIHCEITQNDNKYRLRLYYTTEHIDWPLWVFGILYVFLISSTKVLAKGDDTINMIIFFVGLAIVLRVTHVALNSGPQLELYNNCKYIKKELEAYIKLELEP